MIDAEELRRNSIATAERLGYPTCSWLGLIEGKPVTRSTDDIVDRILAMSCVAGAAYGFDRKVASDWLSLQRQSDFLTPAEREFLSTGVGNVNSFIWQIEGLCALAWSISIFPELNFAKDVPDDFVTYLPSPKNKEISAFRNAAVLRPLPEILAAADLAYCLHWAVVEANLRSLPPPGVVEWPVIEERRRALEWLISEEDWDDVSMDT